MATLNFNVYKVVGTAWDSKTYRGYANGKSAMISLGVPFAEEDDLEINYRETDNRAVDSVFITRLNKLQQVAIADGQNPNVVWKYPPLTYIFPYAPVEASISDLAREYVEIDRPASQSLIAPKSPRLMKASFTCLVTDRNSRGLVSVEADLQHLAEMARRDSPVAFSGFGTFFSRVPTDQVYRLWRITEMSISVRRRHPVTGDITQAEVQFSITEDSNPALVSTILPKIIYTPYVIKRKKKTVKKTLPPKNNEIVQGYAEAIAGLLGV